MKFIPFFLSACIVLASTALQAQSSQKILDELSKKAQKYESVHATYSSRLIDKVNDIDQSQDGEVYVKGDKYNLELGNYVMITDGETLWTYDSTTNDCYVDYLEDVSADEAITPSKMFTVWEQDFKNEFKETIQENGQSLYWVNLYPNDPADKPFHTIQLYIDKDKMEVVRFVVKGREGNDIIYKVKSFETNTAMPAGVFRFDKKKFPGVNIIDNRI